MVENKKEDKFFEKYSAALTEAYKIVDLKNVKMSYVKAAVWGIANHTKLTTKEIAQSVKDFFDGFDSEDFEKDVDANKIEPAAIASALSLSKKAEWQMKSYWQDTSPEANEAFKQSYLFDDHKAYEEVMNARTQFVADVLKYERIDGVKDYEIKQALYDEAVEKTAEAMQDANLRGVGTQAIVRTLCNYTDLTTKEVAKSVVNFVQTTSKSVDWKNIKPNDLDVVVLGSVLSLSKDAQKQIKDYWQDTTPELRDAFKQSYFNDKHQQYDKIMADRKDFVTDVTKNDHKQTKTKTTDAPTR